VPLTPSSSSDIQAGFVNITASAARDCHLAGCAQACGTSDAELTIRSQLVVEMRSPTTEFRHRQFATSMLIA
jgi:hypothetical protein